MPFHTLAGGGGSFSGTPAERFERLPSIPQTTDTSTILAVVIGTTGAGTITDEGSWEQSDTLLELPVGLYVGWVKVETGDATDGWRFQISVEGIDEGASDFDLFIPQSPNGAGTGLHCYAALAFYLAETSDLSVVAYRDTGTNARQLSTSVKLERLT